MSMESSLMTYLVADTTLAALVSTRIYMNTAPEAAAYPHLVYWRTGTARDYALFGAPGLKMPTFSFICVSQTHTQALSVAEAVISALDFYVGVMGDVVVHDSLWVNQYDSYDDDKEVQIITLAFSIWYTNSS